MAEACLEWTVEEERSALRQHGVEQHIGIIWSWTEQTLRRLQEREAGAESPRILSRFHLDFTLYCYYICLLPHAVYIYACSSVGGPPDQVWSMDLTPRPPPVVVEGGLLT